MPSPSKLEVAVDETVQCDSYPSDCGLGWYLSYVFRLLLFQRGFSSQLLLFIVANRSSLDLETVFLYQYLVR